MSAWPTEDEIVFTADMMRSEAECYLSDEVYENDEDEKAARCELEMATGYLYWQRVGPGLLAACRKALAAVAYAEAVCKDGSDWGKDEIVAAIAKAEGK